jgi:hypothetical protein
MACLRSLEQTTVDGTWVGRDLRTNRPIPFTTLADYQQYTKSLESQGTYCAPVTPIYNTQAAKAVSTQVTGFMEFQPQGLDIHAKYSAMSPSWEGIASSDAAIARGEYTIEPPRPAPRPLVPEIPAWHCSVQ